MSVLNACLHVHTHAPHGSDVGPIECSADRFHLRRGVDGGVSGGTLRDAGTVVDDVLLAVGVLVALLLPPAPVVKILAEGKGDAAPALVGEIVLGTALHTVAVVAEASARHAVAGRVWLGAATQALVVAALVVPGAGSVFALDRTHCGQREVKLSWMSSVEQLLSISDSFPISTINTGGCQPPTASICLNLT